MSRARVPPPSLEPAERAQQIIGRCVEEHWTVVDMQRELGAAFLEAEERGARKERMRSRLDRRAS